MGSSSDPGAQTCQKCRSSVPADARFCGVCGHPQNVGAAPPPPPRFDMGSMGGLGGLAGAGSAGFPTQAVVPMDPPEAVARLGDAISQMGGQIVASNPTSAIQGVISYRDFGATMGVSVRYRTQAHRPA